jgi:NB-ARC domain
VLSGLGGVGKTSVAVEFVYRHQADYELVWCVNGEQPANLLADLADLAGKLGLETAASQEAQVAALRDWLERHQRWLLVLDNVEGPEQVAELLPRSATGQVVLTSRSEVGWEPLASVLPVEVLAPADAAQLLVTRAGETGPAAKAAATTLAATLGGPATGVGAGGRLRRRDWHGHPGRLCGAVRHPGAGVAQAGAAAGLSPHRRHDLVVGTATLGGGGAARRRPARPGELSCARRSAPTAASRPCRRASGPVSGDNR